MVIFVPVRNLNNYHSLPETFRFRFRKISKLFIKITGELVPPSPLSSDATGLKLCKLQFNMATKSDYKIYGGEKNIKFLPTLCQYFTVLAFDPCNGMYEQYFYTNIGRILYV